MTAATNRERSPAIRLTAAERRNAIVDAATHDFSLGGVNGTPAAGSPLRAGVSQAHLLALSGTKRNLFIAAVKRGLGRVRGTILRAAEEQSVAGDSLHGARTALEAWS
jgi:AcrR family transcriptional regulator